MLCQSVFLFFSGRIARVTEGNSGMNSGTANAREALIRLCALRLRYRRACRNRHSNICDLAALLVQVEDAERHCEAGRP